MANCCADARNGDWLILLGLSSRYQGKAYRIDSSIAVGWPVWFTLVSNANFRTVYAAEVYQWIRNNWCDGNMLSIPGGISTDEISRKGTLLDGNVLDSWNYSAANNCLVINPIEISH